MDNDIAIIGMNCRYPGIHSVEAFEAILAKGENVLSPQVDNHTSEKDGKNTSEQRITLNNTYEQMDLFDAGFFGFTPSEAQTMDPQHRLFLECSWQMFERAGYNPREHDSKVSAFAGVSTSFYLLNNLMSNQEVINNVGDLSVMIGNDKDHLTAQLAYKLNFTGPCVTVQASCASSLVSVHMACETLLSHQCDVALAGGVTLRLPNQKDYVYREDGLLSADGHIHTFDAAATGTVYSSGVSMVLLKRAQDAIDDGDQIYGIIKGSAVGNDGAQRAGYTAPGVEGQVDVIVEAQSVANIQPHEVGYVEVHGSGTPLGDSIEFEALKQAFSRGSELPLGACPVGSVKTNLGHVEMASGVAGLIKTVLGLANKKRYASLNYETANPKLGLEQSPFYVNTRTTDWASDTPRIAGVSSFGLGGVNCHVVVQEPPVEVPNDHEVTEKVRGEQLFVLSANSESALHQGENALVQWLSSTPQVSLQDVAYTLQVGRASLPYRKAVVASNVHQLIEQLRSGKASQPASQLTGSASVLVLGQNMILEHSLLLSLLQLQPELVELIESAIGVASYASLRQHPDYLSAHQQTFLSQFVLTKFLQLSGYEADYYLSGDNGDAAAAVLVGHLSFSQAWQDLAGQFAPADGLHTYWLLWRDHQWSAQLPPDIFIESSLVLVLGDAGDILSELAPEKAPELATEVLVNHEQLLNICAHLWQAGRLSSSQQLDTHSQSSRILMPGTQFDRERFWVEPRDVTVAAVAPALPFNGDMQEQVKQIWQRVLGKEIDDPEVSFFALGGHSLLASQILFEVRSLFSIDVTLQQFFQQPTLQGLCAQLNNSQGSDIDSTALPDAVYQPDELHQPFPLTDVQQAYWVGRNKSMNLGNTSTHIYFEYELADFDFPRMNAAINQVIERHDMLRAVIESAGTQRILPSVPQYSIERYDGGGYASETFKQSCQSLRALMSHQVIDCSQWPLFDFRAVHSDENTVRLHVSFDLLIADAWSLELFIRDLSHYYHQTNDTPLAPLQYSFRDYVLTLKRIEETELYDKSEQYWQQRIEQLPPGPRLPLVTEPGMVGEPSFKRRSRVIGRAIWQRLKNFASQSGLTPTGLLLSCFSEVLARWSEMPQFTLNLTIFNRLPIHDDMNDIIGDFTSLTLLAVDFGGDLSFEDKAKRLQTRLWEDLDHRHYSGVKASRLLMQHKQDPAQAIIPVVFTSLLNQENAVWDSDVDDSRSNDDLYSISQTPQVWLDHQIMEREGALHFNWDVVEQLFESDTVDAMFDCYCDLLTRLAGKPQLWASPSPLDLKPVAAAVDTGDIVVGGYGQTLLHSGLLTQAALNPEQLAVIDSQRQVSYGELDCAANQTGWMLREGGIIKGELVAVVMDKSWQQIAAVHGILRVAGGYIPIDPNWPQQRQQDLLAVTQARFVITQSHLAAAFIDSGFTVMVIDEQWCTLQSAPLPALGIAANDLAYVIFTSGSTGQPKGVMISHQSAMNTIIDINQRFDLTATDRIFTLSALSFDLSVWDVFAPYFVGAGLVMPSVEGLKDPRHWGQLLSEHQVTIWNTVPALLQMLTEFNQASDNAYPALRLALLSGDWIPLNLPDDAKHRLNNALSLISLGGATECSIWSVFYPVEQMQPQWSSIPYGRGLTNQPLYVLNDRMDECPVGVKGEIYIGGAGLAIGYYKDPEKTTERFVYHPLSGERLYRTGDLGRYYADGVIEFIGRLDNQVKVNGFRVELGEIEQKALEHPLIDQVAVVAIGARNNLKLVALVKPVGGTVTAQEQLIDENIIVDPGERLAFKLQQKNIRQPGGPATYLPLREDPQKLIKRRSYRNFEQQSVSVDQLSNLLSVLAASQFEQLPFDKYRYASAGGLYPVQTYVYIHPDKVDGLKEGVYYYDPLQHALVCVTPQVNLPFDCHAGANASIAAKGAFSLFFVADMAAIEPMYGHDAGWHFSVLEAGMMNQLLEEEASGHQLGLCQLGMVDFDVLKTHFSLDSTHRFIHCTVGGFVSENQHNEAALLVDFSTYKKTDKPQEDADAGVDIAEVLKEYLLQLLPGYMVPQSIIVVDALPLTTNGKLDRNKISEQALSAVSRSLDTEVETSQEIDLAVIEIWKSVLELDKISLTDDFFALKGSSIELVRVQVELEALVGQEVPIFDLFRLPTVKDVSAYVSELLGHYGSIPSGDEHDGGSPEEMGLSDAERANARKKNYANRRTSAKSIIANQPL